MYKKVTPGVLAVAPPVMFPHCDQRVLHAPLECQFCDKHPEWQALRIAWSIAFTGYTPEGNELPCPANHARGDNVNLWHGNTAQPEGVDQ